MIVSIIVAVAKNNIIGNKNKLPWHLPDDLKRFKKITTGHHVVMGQNTFESIGKPLPNRTNIVLTFDKNYKAKGCVIAFSIDEALDIAKKTKEKEVFIIGGASIYKQTLPLADKLYLTRINKEFDGDVFFPKVKQSEWKLVDKSDKFKAPGDFTYSFLVYKRKLIWNKK